MSDQFPEPLLNNEDLRAFDARNFLAKFMDDSSSVNVFSLANVLFWQNVVEYAFASPVDPCTRQWMLRCELDFGLADSTVGGERVVFTGDSDTLSREAVDLLQSLFHSSHATCKPKPSASPCAQRVQDEPAA